MDVPEGKEAEEAEEAGPLGDASAGESDGGDNEASQSEEDTSGDILKPRAARAPRRTKEEKEAGERVAAEALAKGEVLGPEHEQVHFRS